MKGCAATTYTALHADLFKQFREARRKGYKIDFQWLWSGERVYTEGRTGMESDLGKHVVVQY